MFELRLKFGRGSNFLNSVSGSYNIFKPTSISKWYLSVFNKHIKRKRNFKWKRWCPIYNVSLKNFVWSSIDLDFHV